MKAVGETSRDWVWLGSLSAFTFLLLLIALGAMRFDRLMRALGANSNPLLRGRRYELTERPNRIVRSWAGFTAILGVVYLLWSAVLTLRD